ncbi:hypothetical protein [Mycobacteroides salmoniphilum]|uniref:hypothetical protein n=1 Tax=Mycobacteroides salmoniphilum TaxID=404941 RepID=UPI0012FF9A94|nr:hypothetical protein [Mycobacteroides salmoniphilum]
MRGQLQRGDGLVGLVDRHYQRDVDLDHHRLSGRTDLAEGACAAAARRDWIAVWLTST